MKMPENSDTYDRDIQTARDGRKLMVQRFMGGDRIDRCGNFAPCIRLKKIIEERRSFVKRDKPPDNGPIRRELLL